LQANLKDLKSPQKDDVKSFIASMSKPDGLISSKDKGSEYLIKPVLRLTIQGFEFCQKHKEYLGLS
jgi:hypothetical protein